MRLEEWSVNSLVGETIWWTLWVWVNANCPLFNSDASLWMLNYIKNGSCSNNFTNLQVIPIFVRVLNVYESNTPFWKYYHQKMECCDFVTAHFARRLLLMSRFIDNRLNAVSELLERLRHTALCCYPLCSVVALRSLCHCEII